jgi:hypothetical protein
MTLSYFRGGGGRAAIPEGEWIEVDGSTFTAWRQVAQSAVGSFGGILTDGESEELETARAACLSADVAEIPTPLPGSAIVHIDIDGTGISFGSGSPPMGPWGALDDVCRRLCDSAIDRPTGAIGIDTIDGIPRLTHQGMNPITIDLDGASFVAIGWQGWYDEVGRSSGTLQGGVHEVGPGWELKILATDMSELADSIMHVTIEFTIGTGRDATRVAVSHAPELEPPD